MYHAEQTGQITFQGESSSPSHVTHELNPAGDLLCPTVPRVWEGNAPTVTPQGPGVVTRLRCEGTELT
jgi:hypothetical protein